MAEAIKYGQARIGGRGKVHALYDPDRPMCRSGLGAELQPTADAVTCRRCLATLANHDRVAAAARARAAAELPEVAELRQIGWLALAGGDAGPPNSKGVNSLYTVIKMIGAAALGAAAAAALQQRRLERARFDRNFGMLNRSGVDAQLQRLRGSFDAVFVDLDHLHELNDTLGHAELDRRIRQAFGGLRRGDALLIGRWYSGDEIIVIAPLGDGPGLAARLAELLQAQGLGATMGIQSAGPSAAIEQAQRLVYRAKRAGDRGQILLGAPHE